MRDVLVNAGCCEQERSELCSDRIAGQGHLFPLDLGLPLQPPIYSYPFLLIPQFPHNHPESICCQFQSLIPSWRIGDIISKSIEIGSQFGRRDVLGDRYPSQHRGVLVFRLSDGGFQMVDAVQRELVLTF